MDVLITLFYILFSICVIHPPAEFVSAGFTIPQLFDNYLGSESMNFIDYHMKRTTITALIHSLLPAGYIVTLWCAGEKSDWILSSFTASMIIPCLLALKLISWWENNKIKHPIVRALLPYVPPGIDWRSVASTFNSELRSVDKISISLSATSKFVVTQNWLIKVTQYGMNLVKQSDCTLVATAVFVIRTGTDRFMFSLRHAGETHKDIHPDLETNISANTKISSKRDSNRNQNGEDEIQYVNLEAIPTQEDIKRFTLRISTTSLRELQPRLERTIRVPEHISLLPTLIERFVDVFKRHIDENPVYITDQEVELCIGCMQNQADIKLDRRCTLQRPQAETANSSCEQCNCRVLWCSTCMARWWAARAGGPPATWLSARGSCPVCRAAFCLLDVCPARPPAS